jgi:hypothetical protein
MEEIRSTLAHRLAAKGMQGNETELFIKDVIRSATSLSGSNLETIRGHLRLLGWSDGYTDYGTILLVQACYQDG